MGKHSEDAAENDTVKADVAKAFKRTKAEGRRGGKTHDDDIEQTEKDYGIKLRKGRKK